jgi:hypothetical protein|tara:strand:+ start:4786 stop:5256 length:471 start_codon:yes stop_codon:yes gene_type:complete
MWSHYTNSYNGFVIKIKPDFGYLKDLGFHDLKLLHVIYSEKPNSVSENAPFANQYQLVIKLEDWSYENEWRLIVDKTNPDFNQIFYEPDTIQEISFGYKMHHNKNEEHVKLMHRLDDLIHSKFKEIPLFVVGPDQKEFKLSKIPFKYGTVDDFFSK